MQLGHPERRRAPRSEIKARVMISKDGAPAIPAQAVNISTSGMLVRLEHPTPFNVGEPVTVDVELPADAGAPYAAWGVGTVVRVDGANSAIELRAGSFKSVD